MRDFLAGAAGMLGLAILLGRVPSFREMIGLCIIISSLRILFETKKA